jgi:hypothetical protein
MRPRRDSLLLRTGSLALLALTPVLLGASFSVLELTRSAARIFRGRCVAARAETVDFKGRPLAATAYFFEVSEYLKGDGPRTLTFRQAGTPDRGTSDLGRIAGLTVFEPGSEYVVFLRPVSKAGLTSAAGRGRGVLLVSGETVQVAEVDGRTPAPGAERIAYEAIRRAVRQVLEQPPRRR